MDTELEELNKIMREAKPIGKVPADFKPMLIETYSMDNEGRTIGHRFDISTGISTSEVMIDNTEEDFIKWQAYITNLVCTAFKIPESELIK